MFDTGISWETLAWSMSLLAAAITAGWAVHAVLFRLLGKVARRTANELDDILVEQGRGPSRLALPLLAVLVVSPQIRLPAAGEEILRHLVSLAFMATLAWGLCAVVLALRDLVYRRYDVSVADNLRARAIRTQLDVLVKIVVVVILLVAGATMLMTFERVRQVGVSLLASAGIAGIIVGFAAQRSLGTLFAGIQIAVTQPIRIDDVVIVEGEWGKIEEITLTYVVVRIWDQRRLVLPITYFLEKPFQNWTRVSADLLGTVYLYLDYTVPVDAVRGELQRILEASEHWDGKASGVLVTGTSDRTMEVRALVSAADSGAAWMLRCEVREKLIDFLQREYPGCLPRVRGELRREGTGPVGEEAAEEAQSR